MMTTIAKRSSSSSEQALEDALIDEFDADPELESSLAASDMCTTPPILPSSSLYPDLGAATPPTSQPTPPPPTMPSSAHVGYPRFGDVHVPTWSPPAHQVAQPVTHVLVEDHRHQHQQQQQPPQSWAELAPESTTPLELSFDDSTPTECSMDDSDKVQPSGEHQSMIEVNAVWEDLAAIPSPDELESRQRQLQREVRQFEKRAEYLAQALAGETPHQIEAKRRREEERQEREERRLANLEARIEHQIEREHQREERRSKLMDRMHWRCRSISPERESGAIVCDDGNDDSGTRHSEQHELVSSDVNCTSNACNRSQP